MANDHGIISYRRRAFQAYLTEIESKQRDKLFSVEIAFLNLVNPFDLGTQGIHHTFICTHTYRKIWHLI